MKLTVFISFSHKVLNLGHNLNSIVSMGIMASKIHLWYVYVLCMINGIGGGGWQGGSVGGNGTGTGSVNVGGSVGLAVGGMMMRMMVNILKMLKMVIMMIMMIMIRE